MISTGQENGTNAKIPHPVAPYENPIHARGIMRIGALTNDAVRSGTGFLVTSGGILVTNHHVIDGCNKIFACLLSEDGTECSLYSCRLIMSDTDKDLAIIKLEGDLPEDLPHPVTLSNTTPAVLDEVIAVGFPTSLDYDTFDEDTNGNKITDPAIIENFHPNITKGVISKIGTHIIHDSKIGAGNSGGPLISVKTKEVLGVNAAITKAEGFTITIPSKDVVDLLKKVYDNKGELIKIMHYAEHEVPDFMYQYGTMLITGHEGVKTNIEKGEDLLRRAATKGHEKARWKLVELYEAGTLSCGKPEYEKLIDMLSTIDDASSNSQLFTIYSNKATPHFSETKAFEAASRAVEQGSLAAHVYLADHYIHGKGCEPDYKKAIGLLNKATDDKSVPEFAKTAAYQMKVDCAFEWCIKAAYIFAGDVIKDSLIGRNVPLRVIDHYVLAYAYMLKSYDNDEEKNANQKKAFEHMQKISDMGDGQASMSLGLWSLTRLKEMKKAYDFFKKAIEQGNPDGYAGMAMIISKHDKAATWTALQEGYVLGSKYCAALMGISFNRGVLIKKDIEKAKKFLIIGMESKTYEARQSIRNEIRLIEEKEKELKGGK